MNQTTAVKHSKGRIIEKTEYRFKSTIVMGKSYRKSKIISYANFNFFGLRTLWLTGFLMSPLTPDESF